MALSAAELKELKSLNLINAGMHALMAYLNTSVALKSGIPAPELLVKAKEVIDKSITGVEALDHLLLPLVKLVIIKKIQPRRPKTEEAGMPPPLPPLRYKLHKQWPFNIKPQPTILCVKAGKDIVHMPSLMWKMSDVAAALSRNDQPGVFWPEFYKIMKDQKNLKKIHTKDYAAVKSALEKRLKDLGASGFPPPPSSSSDSDSVSPQALDEQLLEIVGHGSKGVKGGAQPKNGRWVIGGLMVGSFVWN